VGVGGPISYWSPTLHELTLRHASLAFRNWASPQTTGIDVVVVVLDVLVVVVLDVVVVVVVVVEVVDDVVVEVVGRKLSGTIWSSCSLKLRMNPPLKINSLGMKIKRKRRKVERETSDSIRGGRRETPTIFSPKNAPEANNMILRGKRNCHKNAPR
jgi:hypothetical protein